MRIAEEFLIDEFDPDSQDCQTRREDLRIAIVLNPLLEKFEKAINEARKEAIEECAKEADLIREGKNEGDIDKQSILKLINELI